MELPTEAFLVSRSKSIGARVGGHDPLTMVQVSVARIEKELAFQQLASAFERGYRSRHDVDLDV